MLLITEVNEDVRLVCEEKDGKKNYSIEGIFMQSEKANRNGRRYPRKTLFGETNRYIEKYVKGSRALGELGHPDGPTVNLERVSHLITDLQMEGNDVRGKAKILETPYGKIVKGLIDEGAQLGVSSRGMGSLINRGGRNYVKDDFYLATAADIVADPSAPDAFVEGIMEGKEWVWDNGALVEKDIEAWRMEIYKAKKFELDEKKVKVFESFLKKL